MISDRSKSEKIPISNATKLGIYNAICSLKRVGVLTID